MTEETNERRISAIGLMVEHHDTSDYMKTAALLLMVELVPSDLLPPDEGGVVGFHTQWQMMG